MTTCAVVQEIQVVNIIIAEPTDTPPYGCTLVLIPPDIEVQIGYTYQDPYFYDFNGNAVVPPTVEITVPEIDITASVEVLS